MKLLVFTQKIDRNDSVLGFFHNWLSEFARKSEFITVICLEVGEVNLPKNVSVYSLGKEKGESRFVYIKNLYRYLYLIRGSYDGVFVHMNQEYVLLAGVYWKVKKIPVYLWRNHPMGNIFTRLAVLLTTKVFCTSKSAFVARFNKSTIMPVGNDSSLFASIAGVVRKKHSVLMLGRIAPIKHIELALEAINHLVLSGAQITLTIIGSSIARDIGYYNSLKKYVFDNKLSSFVFFLPEEPFNKHPEIFSSYEISLNLTDSGSFDKTILGGTSCGAMPLVSNLSLKGLLPDVCITEAEPKAIANALLRLLDPHIQMEIQKDLVDFVNSQSLEVLVKKLFEEMK
jgi:glycosyltransferase involved in cell wall biosynthesis